MQPMDGLRQVGLPVTRLASLDILCPGRARLPGPGSGGRQGGQGEDRWVGTGCLFGGHFEYTWWSLLGHLLGTWWFLGGHLVRECLCGQFGDQLVVIWWSAGGQLVVIWWSFGGQLVVSWWSFGGQLVQNLVY